MRLAMDFEYFGSLTAEQVNAIAEAYLDELTRVTKKEAVIYSDLSNARSVFGRRLAEKYPLWAAQYGADEPSPNGKWREWVGFQYTDKGRVDGISGDVDRDIFTEGIFLSSACCTDGEKKSPKREKTRTVILYVRPGDTLWKIAREYGTTVKAVAEEKRTSARRDDICGGKAHNSRRQDVGRVLRRAPGRHALVDIQKNRRCVGGTYRNKRDKRPRFDIRGGAY